MAVNRVGPDGGSPAGALLNHRYAIITLAVIHLLTGAAAAQSAGSATIHATTILSPVTLDGRSDEPFWATADSIDGEQLK